MTKVHLIAGPNNSGKSNVLRVAQEILPTLSQRVRARGGSLALNDVDIPLGPPDATERELRIAICAPVPDEELRRLVGGGDNFPVSKLRCLINGNAGRDVLWFEYSRSDDRGWKLSRKQVEAIQARDQASSEDFLVRVQRRMPGIAVKSNGAGNVMAAIANEIEPLSQIPKVETIEAFRQISPSAGGNANGQDRRHSGVGLIERLAELQNPGFDGHKKRERFERINAFLRSLLDDSEARIEIPHSRDSIQVFHNGQWLPLDNYGTGLHEVVILAAAATVLADHLVCIEEPEVHLHPTLQRKLLQYLDQETDNQYLIATHSAHLLDFATASITAARLADGRTKLSPAIEPSEVATISFELGARASDLVQANSVIWVEGPSDRIYLQHWLRQTAPGLVEGIHFSILVYGGRLLKHFSADDSAVDEFIRLPRINRNFAVLIDSDRAKRGAHLDKVKKRVRSEIESVDETVVWITQGYTIENYIPPQHLSVALSQVHPAASLRWKGGQYEGPLSPASIAGRKAPVDKVAVSAAVVSMTIGVDEWLLDLRQQMRNLIEMVRRANS